MEPANTANSIDPLFKQRNELRTIRLALMKAIRDAATWQDVILAAETLNSVNVKFEHLFGDASNQQCAAGSLAGGHR